MKIISFFLSREISNKIRIHFHVFFGNIPKEPVLLIRIAEACDRRFFYFLDNNQYSVCGNRYTQF